jgi:hypothetical protein
MILFASAGLGVVLFLWSRAIWGSIGAMITVTVYGFSPTILAHARLVTADLFAAGFFVLAVLAIWRVLHRISLGGLALTGLAVGGLLLSKFSGLMIAPMALLMVAAKIIIGRPLIVALPGKRYVVCPRWHQFSLYIFSAVMSLIVAWAVIWLAYGFRFDAIAPAMAMEAQSMHYEPTPALLERIYAWRLLPESLIYGLSYTLDFMQLRAAFMHGKYSTTGWSSFFPYAILIKTALPILILVAASSLLLCFAKGRKRLFYKLIPLIVLMVIVLIFAVRSNLNIGHRHVLPLYPVLAVFAGASALLFDISIGHVRRVSMVICSGLLLWLVAASLWIWPHYLAYFNPLVGGPSQGYRHLVDSSLDWGQDLRGLARWLEKNPQNDPSKPVYLLYFGKVPPAYEGLHNVINLKMYPPYSPSYVFQTAALRSGRYCISATELQLVYSPMLVPWTPEKETTYQKLVPLARLYFNRHDAPEAYQKMINALGQGNYRKNLDNFDAFRFGRLLAYLRNREPDAMIGYSILIFDLTPRDIYSAVLGPAEPLMN